MTCGYSTTISVGGLQTSDASLILATRTKWLYGEVWLSQDAYIIKVGGSNPSIATNKCLVSQVDEDNRLLICREQSHRKFESYTKRKYNILNLTLMINFFY